MLDLSRKAESMIMKRWLASVLLMLGLLLADSGHALATDKPNVIVIFTDDQGYADLKIQDQLDDLKTPHLDQLARDGARCTSGYITAPQCIPSRAGIMTGRYQQRFGVDHNGTIPMPLDETLIPQRLQRAGYKTGMVGKWHLEPNHQQHTWIKQNLPNADLSKRVRIPAAMTVPYMPNQRGFTDVFCGQLNRYRANYDLQDQDVDPIRGITEQGYRLDIQTDAALAFIDRNKDKPFFLYLAYYAPHVPLDATDAYLSRFPGEMPRRRRIALAMIAAMDDGVGRIRERLKELGLQNDTLIFFISDNGAPLKITMEDKLGNGPGWDGSRNDPWVGEKGMVSEGGVRVPFIVTWPGTIPAGQVYEHPVSSLDVGATAVELAGIEKPDELDGVNLVPYLTGEATGAPHQALYWRFWNQAAIRQGQWKYLQAGADRAYLFDLSSSEHEKQNLIDQHPDIARKLKQNLQAWAKDLKTPGLPDQGLNGQEVNFYDHYLPNN